MQEITISDVQIKIPHYAGHDPYQRQGQTGELITIVHNVPGSLVFKIKFDKPDQDGDYTAQYDADLWLS